MKRALGPLLCLSLIGCAEAEDDARTAIIVSSLARADEALIRARPALVAGKYARMAQEPYGYYRGSLAVYRSDWEAARFDVSASAYLTSSSGEGWPSPILLGDPHPENIGVLRARDMTFGLEPNDFDGADRSPPYLWDVRRLAAGMSLAARLSNSDDAAANAAAKAASRDVAAAVTEAYAAAIRAHAEGAPRARITSGDGNTILDDLFARSLEDTLSREELGASTVLDGGTRRLVRGALDPEEPTQTYQDLPPFVLDALPSTLEAYRLTLIDPPDPAFFTVLDAVREFGSGVASWPRIRIIALVRGPTDDPMDDVLLEIKELSDATLLPDYPPSFAFDTVGDRVLGTSRAVWAIPDAEPLWGVSTMVGLPCQVRVETEGQKTFRVQRLTGKRGTVAAITGAARVFGALLARAHASPLDEGDAPAAIISASIGDDVAGFVAEQAGVSDAYAAQVLDDHARFVKALSAIGPRLGVPFDEADRPPPDLEALFGEP